MLGFKDSVPDSFDMEPIEMSQPTAAPQETVDDPYEDVAAPQAAAKAPAKPAPKRQVTKQELEHEDKNRMDQHQRDKAQENQQTEQAKQDYNDQAALAAQSMYWNDEYRQQQ